VTITIIFGPIQSLLFFDLIKFRILKGNETLLVLFYPVSINAATGNIDSLKINEALSLAVDCY